MRARANRGTASTSPHLTGPGTSRRLERSDLLVGYLLALGGGLALHVLNTGGLDPSHWLRDASLAGPMGIVAVHVARRLAAPLASRVGLADDAGGSGVGAGALWALLGAIGYALATVPGAQVHHLLFASEHQHAVAHHAGHTGVLSHTLRDVSVALSAALVVLLAVALVRGTRELLPQLPLRERRTGGAHPPGARRLGARTTGARIVAAVLTIAIALPVVAFEPASGGPDEAAAQTSSCGPESYERAYDVSAIGVEIPYNRWGGIDPSGMAYVLDQDKEAVRNWHLPLADDPAADIAGNRRIRPRPLVLRANAGECVKVDFRNELSEGSGNAGISVRGVPYDVQTSDGSMVGFNDDSTAPRGGRVSYYWKAPEEGTYFFSNDTGLQGGEADGGTLSQGLYGALIVEPAGSTWTDPRTGAPLYSATNAAASTPWTGGTSQQSGDLYIDAVINPPGEASFRETVQLSQDEIPDIGMGFNYGVEPVEERTEHPCPDCIGEETALSSWPYGDPALIKLASGKGPWLPTWSAEYTGDPNNPEDCGLGKPGFDADSCFVANVTHSYQNDRLKIRYGHAGPKETHVFHLHGHTWISDVNDTGSMQSAPPRPGPGAMPESPTIDSRTYGPMEMFTADVHFGAGSKAGTVGDSIFHCHLYPHFAEGFWALLRVHDVHEDGTGKTPDGIVVSELQKIPGGANPPAPTADNPGFPRFVPGKTGWRAPQPPMGVTNPDGTDAPRIVAGADVPAPELAVETAVADRLSGGRSKPGAPFTDPCPEGAREVTYDVTTFQMPITYNEAGWHDKQGRMIALTKDVPDILAGRKKPEPLFARVNAGDCVNWKLTNRLPNWFGGDEFQQLTQTNMFGQHIHLLKYDMLASDGGSNGWNYQQAAFSDEQTAFNAKLRAGDTSATCDSHKCRLDTPASWTPPNPTSVDELPQGQTITARWYADYELRTAFTHDHHFPALDQARGQYGALVVEPAGTDFRATDGTFQQPVNQAGRGVPQCVTTCEGTAAGAAMDVLGPGSDDDFREFGLAIADFVSLHTDDGRPIGAPPAPEVFPNEDPGVMAINYRNAPLSLRTHRDGTPVDPAYQFSSRVHGDPWTPVLKTYADDRVKIRLIQGAHEEQHTFTMHGARWRSQPDDPGSKLTDVETIGISEAFNFNAPKFNCSDDERCVGDFLYGSMAIDDVEMGMWGILRAYGRHQGDDILRALPDNPTPSGSSPARTNSDGRIPPAATDPGNPCPTGAPTRTFNVVALDTRIEYNEDGDHDPYGMMYALQEDVAAIRAGEKAPEPLTLRVNEGDCIDVELRNELDPRIQQHNGTADGDALVPTETAAHARPPGMRVSLHPQMLRYDVLGSDGATVGHNPDQTVGPGQKIRYRWYADDPSGVPGELGPIILSDFGDPKGHRHHGLYASLIVEPKGASWHDQQTGEELTSGTVADIRVPGRADFREVVTTFQDGLNLRATNGSIIADPDDHGEPLDAEDSGEKAFSYRSERFEPRMRGGLFTAADPSKVYDSRSHGDPSTPILRAHAGDEVRMQVLHPGDKPRQHGFQLAGHNWRRDHNDPESLVVGTHGGIGPGVTTTVVTKAADQVPSVGDFLYSCPVGFFHRSGGLWGLMRVYPKPDASKALSPTSLGETDDPRAGGNPIMALETNAIEAEVFNDLDGDGVRDDGEVTVKDVEVTATAGTATLKGRTNDLGKATITVAPGSYAVEATPPQGWQRTGTTATADVAGDGQRAKVALGIQEVTPTEPQEGPGQDTTAPGRVTGLQGAGGLRSTTLSWTNPTDPDLAGVEIRVREGTVAPTRTTGEQVFRGQGTSHRVTGLRDGVTYTYAVFTYDAADNQSGAVTRTVDGSRVGLSRSTSKLIRGVAVTLTGEVLNARTGAAVAGQPVELWTRERGTADWKRVASTTSSSTGQVRLSHEPQWSTEYQLRGLGSSGVVGSMSPVSAVDVVPFRDILGTTHEAAITAMSRAAITGGFSDGTFRPNATVTRGQMASFLVKALDLPAASESNLSDIRGHTHEAAIRALAAAGITGGFSDGTFRPNATVTRGQMASFLVKGLELPAASGSSFSDIRGHTHEAAIRALAAAGITGGFSDGTFRPNATVSRGQMASFLMKGLER